MHYKQALFRKIIAALPGMETLSSAELDEMVGVNLNGNASQSDTSTVTPEQIDDTQEAPERINSRVNLNENASQSDTSTVTPEQIDHTEEAPERISSPRPRSGPLQPQRKAPGRFVYLFLFFTIFNLCYYFLLM